MQSIGHQRRGVGAGTAGFGFSGGSEASLFSLPYNSSRKRKASTPHPSTTSSEASHNAAAKRRKMGLLQRFVTPLQAVLVNGFGRLSAQPSLQLDRAAVARQGNNKCPAPQCSPVPRRRAKRSRQPLGSHKDTKAKSTARKLLMPHSRKKKRYSLPLMPLGGNSTNNIRNLNNNNNNINHSTKKASDASNKQGGNVTKQNGLFTSERSAHSTLSARNSHSKTKLIPICKRLKRPHKRLPIQCLVRRIRLWRLAVKRLRH